MCIPKKARISRKIDREGETTSAARDRLTRCTIVKYGGVCHLPRSSADGPLSYCVVVLSMSGGEREGGKLMANILKIARKGVISGT